MSGGTPARVSKSSPKQQGPVKATIPISSVMKSGGLPPMGGGDSGGGSPTLSPPSSSSAAWRMRFSPEHARQRSPGSASYKVKSKTLGASNGNCNVMRRTASLDTIYLKGHWPRDTFYWHTETLQIDKATQTDESDWSDSRKMYFLTENSDDKLEKFMIRQRLQRSSKEANNRSAVAGDHTLNTTTQTAASYILSPVLKVNPMNMPLKPLARPTMRSSVEGLNQEIEKLVLKSTSSGDLQCSERNEEYSKFSQSTPEGHRAPLADLFRITTRSRSVNTQTPVAGDVSTSCHSSGPPSRDSLSPLPPYMDRSPSETGGSQGSSPDQESCSKLGTSPQINRFLAREPPDGCEKVHLIKSLDERQRQISSTDHVPPPPCTFQLRPSLGSAFQTPQPFSSSCSSSSNRESPSVPPRQQQEDS